MRMRHAYDIQQQTEWGEIICEGVSLTLKDAGGSILTMSMEFDKNFSD